MDQNYETSVLDSPEQLLEEHRLKLVLLPGMHGTGKLFGSFASFLPGWIEPQVVSYPSGLKLSYEELRFYLGTVIPDAEPFAILAESFSSPLAVNFADENPGNLVAVIICAGFVSPPIRRLLRPLTAYCATYLFKCRISDWFARRYLVGYAAPPERIQEVRSAVSGIPTAVMAHSLREVLKCNSRAELGKTAAPFLYVEASEDRIVPKRCGKEFGELRPDFFHASIDGPHLIVQSAPAKVAEIVCAFLRMASRQSS